MVARDARMRPCKVHRFPLWLARSQIVTLPHQVPPGAAPASYFDQQSSVERRRKVPARPSHCTKQHGLGAERTMASQPFLPARKPHHGAAQTNQPLTILPPPLTAALQAATLLAAAAAAALPPPIIPLLLCISLQVQSSGNFRHLRQSVLST